MATKSITVHLKDNSSLPVRSSSGAAAYDLTAHKHYTLKPGKTTLVDLNLAIYIPPGFYLQLHSRSSLALQGITTLGGVIDSDYRGSVQAILYNLSDKKVFIKPNQRVTSGVFLPTIDVQFKYVNMLPSSIRGTAGFGSTD